MRCVRISRAGGWRAFLLLCVAAYGPLLQAGEVQLTPQRVMELARTHNRLVQASRLEVDGEDHARRAALTALLPVLSGSVNYTHLDEQPVLDMGAGPGGGGMPGGQPVPGTDSLPPNLKDTVLYQYVQGLFDTLQTGLMQMFSTGPVPLSPQDLWTLGLTLTQPVYMGGRLRNGYKAAEHVYTARRLTHERTRDEIALAALKIFGAYILQRETFLLAEEERRWLEETVGRQKLLFENGMITEHDLLKIQVALAAKKIEELRAHNQTRSLGEQMLVFLGQDPSLTIRVPDNLWEDSRTLLLPPTADTLDEKILWRPDLQGMHRRIDALDRVYRSQLGAYAPAVSAFYSHRFSNQYSVSDNSLEEDVSFGIMLNWTIFDWGRVLQNARKTACSRDALQLTLKEQSERLRISLERLARSIEEDEQALALARQGIELAQKNLHIMQLRFDAGECTSLEVLSARADLSRARLQKIGAQVSRAIHREEYIVGPSLETSGGPAGSPAGTTAPTASSSSSWNSR